MRCPTLNELPPPPPGKTGWPWTEESPQLPDTMPALSTGSGQATSWPRISIVTPSYNQAQFIEETIRSVLMQGYPNLEYIIVDGGSTDGSVDIIRKYEDWLTHWVSEPDRGQAEAINKGWEHSTGHILAWLNSDDVYRPGALSRVAEAFQCHLDAVVVVGACAITDIDRNVLGCKLSRFLDPKHFLYEAASVPGQPAVFLARQVVEEIGGLDESLHYVLDWEYWLRIGMRYSRDRVVLLDSVLAEAREWEGNKTSLGIERSTAECRRIIDQIYADPDNLPADIRPLYRTAYSRTFWRQAKLHYWAGQNHLARRSALSAWGIAPGAYRPLQIPKFIVWTILPSAWARRTQRIKRAVASQK
jgi:glycosyltransferase involved in cell wall biosynthesis